MSDMETPEASRVFFDPDVFIDPVSFELVQPWQRPRRHITPASKNPFMAKSPFRDKLLMVADNV
jgi:hypothetical protein